MRQCIRKRMRDFKRVLCMLLVGMILFTSVDLTALAASGSVEVYYLKNNNVSAWGNSIRVYAWDANGELCGGWPGTGMTDLGNGLYKATVNYKDAQSFKIIFNDGSGNQTNNIVKSDIASSSQWLFTANSDKNCDNYAVSTKDVVLHFKNSDWTATNIYAWQKFGSAEYHNAVWPGSDEVLTTGNFVTASVTYFGVGDLNFIFNNGSSKTSDLKISATDLASSSEWWIVKENNTYTYSSTNPDNTSTETIELSAASVSMKETETVTLTATTSEGVTGVEWTSSDDSIASVSNGVITAKKAGKAVITATTPGGASATCVVNVSVKSPIVNGSQVTFKYEGSASKVFLAGTMNGWSSSAKEMTKENGIFSCTLDLEPGTYEYKYVIDGQWSPDPSNGVIVGKDGNSYLIVPGYTTKDLSFKEGKPMILPSEVSYLNEDGTETSKTVASYTSNTNGVSISDKTVTLEDGFTAKEFQVTATTTDGDTVNIDVEIFVPSPVVVKIHYDRSDNKESDWNAWVWGDFAGDSDGYSFKAENGEYVATFTIPAESVPYVNTLKYKIRLGNWLAEEGERQIDISGVVGGTVHSRVDANGGYTTDYSDAVIGTKLKNINYDRSSNKIVVNASGVIADYEDAFAIKRLDGTSIAITSVTQSGTTYTISIAEDISSLIDVTKTYKLTYDDLEYHVTMPNLYKTEEFENAYTYEGDDLGATWTSTKTIFKVWAPTADSVKVQLYATGSDEEANSKKLELIPMIKGSKGVWAAEVTGDLNGIYYTYITDVNGSVEESCDPYARTTGVNGERAMVINLDETDPEGWDEDVSPNKDMTYTDAVIYELHVRDLSIDDESGVKEEWQGKFLGLTQTGTTNSEGYATGLDHIIELGVTHIHLLPSYDYASIDETLTEAEKAANPDKQFNWGYDPENYNVPEGSYSTNPYDGAVRVAEMKEMVQTLHENNINVIMDVVYNHVYDAGTFSFNEIVPNYFSRTNADGSFSNGSGCGNDTASERAMVRKYIVDSVKYWADEYHIDGFRFDLVGLLDAETINLIVEEVHETHPDVIFYGEGWTMNTAVQPEGTTMATQQNAWATPQFAYFSDTFRDFIKGKNDETSWGYVQNTMDGDPEGTLMSCFKAATGWIQNPTQVINYASCHDNYTLMDKINATKKNASVEDRIKMNNLAASAYMLAEGIPLIHAGEEILRTKVDSSGHIIHNSYNVPDYINSLKWDNLDNEAYRDVVDYYSGLIEFRKNHAALRLTKKSDVQAYVKEQWVDENIVLFNITTTNIPDEVSDGIVVIFNSNPYAKTFSMYDKGVSRGTWNICINDEAAGTEVLGTVTNGQVTVPAISVLVLVKGETVDTSSVYTENNNVSIQFNKATTSVAEEKKVTLDVTVNPEGSTLVWSSSDESVATVSNGVVTGVSEGTATITVSTLHGLTATCEVTVTEKVDDPADDPSDTPTDKPSDTPTDTPTDKPADKPADTPSTEKDDVVYVPEGKNENKVSAELEKLVEKIENNESVKGIVSDETLSAIKEALDNNKTLKTDVTVTNTKADKVEDNIEKLVEVEAKELAKENPYVIVQYMDINMFIKDNSGEVLGTLNELSEEITLTFEIPSDWRKEGRTFSVIRVHDDKTDVLAVTENADGTVSFKTDKFSVYALVYVDSVVETTNPINPINPTNPISPNTGDDMNVVPLLVLFTVGIVLVVNRKKKFF